MKKIRIGLIFIASILLTLNFIILYNNKWNSTKTGSILMAISMICVITSSIISLIQETKMRKLHTQTKRKTIYNYSPPHCKRVGEEKLF